MRHEIPSVYFSACVFCWTARLAKVKHNVSIADLRPHEVLPPHNLWMMADQLFCTVAIGWSSSGPPGCFDAVFTPCAGAGGAPAGQVLLPIEDAAPDRPLDTYANTVAPADQGPRAALLPVLRADLRERLPEYMIPAAFVLLDALPLLPNGKVDRRALPDPERTAPDRASAFVTPRTSAEAMLAGIWAELLGVEQVGVDDSFFDLGGHSLLVVKLAARVRDAFGVELPVASFFGAPTVAGLVQTIEAARQAMQPAV